MINGNTEQWTCEWWTAGDRQADPSLEEKHFLFHHRRSLPSSKYLAAAVEPSRRVRDNPLHASLKSEAALCPLLGTNRENINKTHQGLRWGLWLLKGARASKVPGPDTKLCQGGGPYLSFLLSPSGTAVGDTSCSSGILSPVFDCFLAR